MTCLKKYLPGAMAVLLFAVTSAHAETPLSLQDAIDLALINNERLRQTAEDRQSAAERVKEAKGALFPKVEASYNYSRYFKIRDIPQYYNVAPDMGTDGSYSGIVSPGDPLGPDNPLGWHTVPLYGPAVNDNEHTAGITATQILYTSGRVMNYLRSVETSSDAMDNIYLSEKRNLVFNVQTAYLDSLMNREAVVISKESLENALDDHTVIKNKLREGLASDFDVMQHEVTVQNFRVKLNKAENGFQLATNNLKTLIGIRFTETVTLTDSFIDDFPVLEFNKLLEDMTENDPALKATKHQIRSNTYLLKAKKADYFPVLTAFGSAEKSGDSMDFFPEDDEIDDTVVAGINLTIPIYEGGMKQSRVSQAAHDLNKSKLEYDKIKKLLRLDLENAYLTYLSSQRELATSADTVKVAQTAYGLAKLRYDNGLGSRSDLEDASLALSNASLLYYRFKRNTNYYLYKIHSYCPWHARSKS